MVLSLLACSAEAVPRLVERWSCGGFDTPESVLYDAAENVLYVSNISGNPAEKNGAGFISKLSLEGQMETLKWAIGLNAPKGMAMHGGRLYVSDIDELVEINLKSGKITQRYPAEGALFLNDVAADAEGRIYVGDSSAENSALYRWVNGTLEVWLRDPTLIEPNGLHMLSDRLWVGNAAQGGLHAVMLDSRKVFPVAQAATGIDGLKPWGEGFLISNWAGQTSFVTAAGETVPLLDTTAAKINAADFEFIADQNVLIIPTFFDHRVVAYEVVADAGVHVGTAAPAFEAKDQDGNLWRLADHLGKNHVVVYFYPAAMTGGCTKQACSYRDFKQDGGARKIEIVGVSGDSPQNLKHFQQAHHLNFTLLSDPDGTIAQRYGVPVKQGKKSIHRTVDGQELTLERSSTAARWTFIVDPQGNVVYRDTKVSATRDPAHVAAFLGSLEE